LYLGAKHEITQNGRIYFYRRRHHDRSYISLAHSGV
jgi:hypothetical protein